jgi:flagellar FliL protein
LATPAQRLEKSHCKACSQRCLSSRGIDNQKIPNADCSLYITQHVNIFFFNPKESPAMADNKATKKSDDASTDQGPPKKKIILIGVAALLFLIILGVAAFFWLKKNEANNENPAAIQASPIIPSTTIGPMIEIKEFVVNIISEGDSHYVKAALTIELDNNPAVIDKKTAATGNDLAMEEATLRMPQIRDGILLLIGNKTYEELQDLQGKKQLKAELASRINSILQRGKVKEIYFTDFVVQ